MTFVGYRLRVETTERGVRVSAGLIPDDPSGSPIPPFALYRDDLREHVRLPNWLERRWGITLERKVARAKARVERHAQHEVRRSQCMAAKTRGLLE